MPKVPLKRVRVFKPLFWHSNLNQTNVEYTGFLRIWTKQGSRYPNYLTFLTTFCPGGLSIRRGLTLGIRTGVKKLSKTKHKYLVGRVWIWRAQKPMHMFEQFRYRDPSVKVFCHNFETMKPDLSNIVKCSITNFRSRSHDRSAGWSTLGKAGHSFSVSQTRVEPRGSQWRGM